MGLRAPAARRRWVAVIALLAVVAVGLIVGAGRQPRERASLVPAGDTLIAYSYDGDIYLGDPVTGETTAIVTDPEYETNPVFSPEGTLHESFPWALDGRSLLVLERHRTRPWVVDVETGELTELPWEADSGPS